MQRVILIIVHHDDFLHNGQAYRIIHRRTLRVP
jgi:hypothetical protein